MRRSWWMMTLLGVCLTVSGWACATAWSDDDQPGDKPAARDKEDRPRPPRPDGEREGLPPRRDGDFGGPGPRREGEGPGPRRDGDRPEGGPRREGDRPDGPPPQRPDGPPPRREGEGGRPPFGQGMGPGFGPPREADLERMKEHDPEMYELLKQDNDLDRDTRSLAEKVRKLATGVKDREKLEIELKELVQKHFDVRQKRREIELKRVEEQLSRLRDSIKTRLEGREESIRRRLAELVGRPEDLGF